MKTIKILLMGITGDLAKRKVMPAIAQFAEINRGKFAIELIGFSRSKVSQEEILDLLNINSTESKHKLDKISYIQGQYDDAELLDCLFSQLQSSDRLIIYLAVPPNVFISFLQKACPLHHANIDIIIEKPFGQSLEEAQAIINQTKNCVLTRRINFFDHYAFKVSSKINPEILEQLAQYVDGDIKKIEIKALESVNIEGRSGYYEGTGSLKDMFQHINTIYNLAKDCFSLPVICSDNISVNSLVTGQYDNYNIHSGNQKSNTETYFCLTLKGVNGLQILFESGKSLGLKSTSISLYFENKTIIQWNFDSKKQITMTRNGNEIVSFNSIESNILDHTRLFESLVNDNFDEFVSAEQVIETWKLCNMINRFKQKNKIETVIYKSDFYPIQVI